MSNTTSGHGDQEPHISGYDYGHTTAAHSPLSLKELRQLEETIGWTDKDAELLTRHGEIFKRDAERMVDAWREVIGSQHHLVKWFFGPDGKLDAEYAAKVKKRFVQWVVDAVFRPHDRAWLDYQEEIALRHTPQKKNQTDGAQTPPLVPLRYLFGFVTVVTLATRRFFLDAGMADDELRHLEDAWAKAVQLHVTLWSRPYAKDGERRGYAFALNAARHAGNSEAVRELEAIAPYPPADTSKLLEKLYVQRKWVGFYGGVMAYRRGNSDESDLAYLSPDYTDAEIARIWEGNKFSEQYLLAPLLSLDLSSTKRLDCPLIIFAGRHDLNVNSEVAAEWFAKVNAPSKQFVWFENSAHMPMTEEPGKFLYSLLQYARPLTQRTEHISNDP